MRLIFVLTFVAVADWMTAVAQSDTLIGTWRSPFPRGLYQGIEYHTFAKNGQYRRESRTLGGLFCGEALGTWKREAGRVRIATNGGYHGSWIRAGADEDHRVMFHPSGRRFQMVRTGEVKAAVSPRPARFVGTWTGRATLPDGTEVDTIMTLRVDGTAARHDRAEGWSTSKVMKGTWAAGGGMLIIRDGMAPVPMPMRYKWHDEDRLCVSHEAPRVQLALARKGAEKSPFPIATQAGGLLAPLMAEFDRHVFDGESAKAKALLIDFINQNESTPGFEHPDVDYAAGMLLADRRLPFPSDKARTLLARWSKAQKSSIGRCRLLMHQSAFEWTCGARETALKLMREAIDSAADVDDRLVSVNALRKLARLQRAGGEKAEALKTLQRALEIAEAATGVDSLEAFALLIELGATSHGNDAAVAGFYRRAARIFELQGGRAAGMRDVFRSWAYNASSPEGKEEALTRRLASLESDWITADLEIESCIEALAENASSKAARLDRLRDLGARLATTRFKADPLVRVLEHRIHSLDPESVPSGPLPAFHSLDAAGKRYAPISLAFQAPDEGPTDPLTYALQSEHRRLALSAVGSTAAQSLLLRFPFAAPHFRAATGTAIAHPDPSTDEKTAEWLANYKNLALRAMAVRAASQRAIRKHEHEHVHRRLLSALDWYAHATSNAKTLTGALRASERMPHFTRDLETLEDALGTGAAHFDALTRWTTLPEIRAALPEDGVLVMFFVHVEPSAERTLHAWIVPGRPSRTVRHVTLGAVSDLERLLGRIRTLSSLSPAKARGALKAGYTRVWTPLGIRDDERDVMISSEGVLHAIPWAALIDPESGESLVTRKVISLITHGAAVTQDATAASSNSVLVFGDADFTVADPTWSRPYAPLPGTAVEVKAAKKFLTTASGSAVTTLLGRDASRRALLSADRPRALVIATHGYYRTHGSTSPSVDLRGDIDREQAAPRPFDPLDLAWKGDHPFTRSGLVLSASGSAPTGHRDPREVSARDIVTLDLTGTQFVVLSACQTGLGEATTGQGIVALQTAFWIAGARSVVASLWSVPDEPTAQLMAAFYREIGLGHSASIAMTNAQRSILAAHPGAPVVNWAGFQVLGR